MKRLFFLSLFCFSFTLFSADDDTRSRPRSEASRRAGDAAMRRAVKRDTAAAGSEAGSAAGHAAEYAEQREKCAEMQQIPTVTPEEILAMPEYAAYHALATYEMNEWTYKITDAEPHSFIRFQIGAEENNNPIYSTKFYPYSNEAVRNLSQVLKNMIDNTSDEDDSIIDLRVFKQDFDALLNNDFTHHSTLDDFIRLFWASNFLDIINDDLSLGHPKIQMMITIINHIFNLNEHQFPHELKSTGLCLQLKRKLHDLFLTQLRDYKLAHPEYEIQHKIRYKLEHKPIAQIATEINMPVGCVFGGFSVQDLIFCGLIPAISIEGVSRTLDLCNFNLTSLDGLLNVPGINTVQVLYIANNPLTALPDSIGQLVSLTKLNLSGCTSLRALPNSIGHLLQLKILIISKCTHLTTLPNSIGQLVNLTDLSLNGCTSLTELPESIGQLGHLSYLNLNGCGSLTALPENLMQQIIDNHIYDIFLTEAQLSAIEQFRGGAGTNQH